MKTQLRFGFEDIKIMIKDKDNNEGYKKVNIDVIADPKDIPEFDFGMKWKHRTDCLPRQRMSSSPDRGLPISLRGQADCNGVQEGNRQEAGLAM